jgi:hypothetical protein
MCAVLAVSDWISIARVLIISVNQVINGMILATLQAGGTHNTGTNLLAPILHRYDWSGRAGANLAWPAGTGATSQAVWRPKRRPRQVQMHARTEMKYREVL